MLSALRMHACTRARVKIKLCTPHQYVYLRAATVENSVSMVRDSLAQLSLSLDAKRCPRELQGRWRIDPKTSSALCPTFLRELGVPSILCPAVALLERSTEITITCLEGSQRMRIEDKTALSPRNVTEVSLDGVEVEKATKTGRKRFMLSGAVSGSAPATSIVRCRLHQRGSGWETRQERTLLEKERMRERNVLVRPGHEDVTVDRFFTRIHM